MYPNAFAYERPSTVAEATRLLKADPDAKVIAGGHSLLPAMKLRLANPTTLVDIARIPGLSDIEIKDGGARIGALTTYQKLLEHGGLGKVFPIIAEATEVVGDPAVRARGTIGGSLAHSDPAADLPAVMLALDAKVAVVGADGRRSIDIDRLFVDLLTTSLRADEIITAIDIPAPFGKGMAYEKHAHPASGYAVVGVAVVIDADDGVCNEIRVAITGAGVKATRATSVERALKGHRLAEDTIAAVASMATNELGEINSDVYASADYRAHLTKVLTKRAILRAAASY